MILLCIDCSTASLPKTGNGLLIFVTRKGLALVPWANLPRITCVRVYVTLFQSNNINKWIWIYTYIYIKNIFIYVEIWIYIYVFMVLIVHYSFICTTPSSISGHGGIGMFSNHEVIESRDSWWTDGHWTGRCTASGPGTHDAWSGWIDLGRGACWWQKSYKPPNSLSIQCVSHCITVSWRFLYKWPDFLEPSNRLFSNGQHDIYGKNSWNSHEVRGM